MTACFTLLNDDYFNNLILQINSAVTPDELQSIVNQAFADIQTLESTITSQLAYLEPISALLTAPGANLTAIVTWITTFITTVLTPIYKPYITMTAQLISLATQIAKLTAAIESAQASLSINFPNISINIPAINPNFCTL